MKQQINCYEVDGVTVKKTLDLPEVFSTPIRQDLVLKTYSIYRMKTRQPYAVSKYAGMQHSAESWGTGRAIARVPRVKGGGTRRAGQGAFANFCRKGRMAHPTKTHRRWARKVVENTKKIAEAMAVAASAQTSLVEARGHRVSNVKMLPIIVSDDISKAKKTKDALQILKDLNMKEELKRIEKSRGVRCGKGKMRNRRYTQRKGILIVHGESSELLGFRNIRGVDQMSIDSLDLLELAPGGLPGRLIIWTESAFEKLDKIFGGVEREAELTPGFKLPDRIVAHDDLEELFYSDAVQAILDEPLFVGRTELKLSDEEMKERLRFVKKLDPSAIRSTN
ncbi:60S ribosomal protein L4 [Encephalitozoon intestinalis ATCC 50506]|uniref:Large ribosomal subunit protein uL4 n=1 Tax=Encephalitozoon intestinalis (strain ATCC 50506) TaxID=876142 RepID=E0S8L8_ENCIT|nr:60S ribosomal protein L4 [Encephalitozoon intestinalis ATCC 50506]ADM12012.1 60S ribosomal protein L4 [Encephalitozoon intestinalis ATCC 50506]UTX45800.1 ribosomal protein L4 [Encephalitozoon intestinalis]